MGYVPKSHELTHMEFRPFCCVIQIGQHMRFWYLSHIRKSLLLTSLLMYQSRARGLNLGLNFNYIHTLCVEHCSEEYSRSGLRLRGCWFNFTGTVLCP